MGAITGILGINGQGSGFQAQGAPTAAQQVAAQQATTGGLAQYQQFLQALQASNGVGNQSNVYNQLQGIASGTGPNPAQAMLAQATGANNANQAALMAGQRGAGANAGLIARQAAQQGAANQQNSAGQAATLQANQSLNALGQAGQIAGNQVNQTQAAAQGVNSAALQGQSNLINAQNNANSTNAQIASTQAQSAGDLIGGILNGGASLLTSKGGIAGLFADGGEVGETEVGKTIDPSGPKSFVGRHMLMAKGGRAEGANAMVSPGEVRLRKEQVEQVARGADPMKVGEKIPGKASVKGDSLKNDTVPKHLNEGDIILPRHITTHPDAPAKAAEFVKAILAKHRLQSKGKK
jgi:hypothetical protein